MQVQPLGWEDPLEEKIATRSSAGLGRSPGEAIGYPLQYSGLENYRLSDFHFHITFQWQTAVHGVAKT